METAESEAIAAQIATVQRGCIVAAAGCGKTEQVVRALAHTEGRRLILTHTHAGVDALRRRLKERKVSEWKFAIDTIAGWSLRIAASFPARSGLKIVNPEDSQWDEVYRSALTLLKSRAISRVLNASYSGLFVDEYQDCTKLQHDLILSIADQLPTCIFGDPLQAIFGFKDQEPVVWETEVYPKFPVHVRLTTPWRWRRAGNKDLANWLEGTVRKHLEQGKSIDVNSAPTCVSSKQLSPPSTDRATTAVRQQTILSACKSVNVANGEKLIVLGHSANLKSRAKLAKDLSAMGFRNIEPLDCPHLFEHGDKIEREVGIDRLGAVLDFLQATMTGVPKTPLLNAIRAHREGRRAGAKKFGELFPLCTEISQGRDFKSVLSLLEHYWNDSATSLYRHHMFYAMCAALRLLIVKRYEKICDAIWEVQNRTRHAGRHLGKRNIGSTLLVKGLEFDHAVIIDADRLSRNDLYVALTRASRTVTVLSNTNMLNSKD